MAAHSGHTTSPGSLTSRFRRATGAAIVVVFTACSPPLSVPRLSSPATTPAATGNGEEAKTWATVRGCSRTWR